MKYVRCFIIDYFYISDVTLEITAGTETRTVTQDTMLERQEDAKRAARTAANKNPRRR